MALASAAGVLGGIVSPRQRRHLIRATVGVLESTKFVS